MRTIYKAMAIAGTLGIFGALAVNFLGGGDSPSTITPPENRQQAVHTFEVSVEPSEPVTVNDTDTLVDPTESEAIDAYFKSVSDEVTGFEEDQFPDEDLLANVKPFLGHEAGLKYELFFDQIDSEESLSEDQIQEFFKKMLATLETSEEARDAIAQAYRDTKDEDAMKRGILTEMLMKTTTGREILLNEAKAILANGQEERFADMFQTFQNVEEKMNSQVLDLALFSAATSKDLSAATSALNYIGRLENDKDFSPIYTSQAISTLENIALYNENVDVRSLATQKLYRILGPQQSTTVAQYNIDNNVSTPLVIETLYSISSGDVSLTPDLQNSLVAALNREGVTPEEVELAKTILRTTQGS